MSSKNLVSALNTVAAAAMLAWHGAVDWPPTLVMMSGATFGGMIGGAARPRHPAGSACAGCVIAFGALLTADLRLAVLVLGSPRDCVSSHNSSRFVIALSGSAIASQTVKWFMPGTAS